MTYRFVFPYNQEPNLTPEQVTSLTKIAERWDLTETVEVSPMFGGGGAVIVGVGSMWIGVETDGHSHT